MAYTKIDGVSYQKLYGGSYASPNNDVNRRVAMIAKNKGLHPDGKAWKKCCCGDTTINPGRTINCAFTDGRITANDKSVAKQPFICVHRDTPDGYLRVCAGWDACFGKNYKEE